MTPDESRQYLLSAALLGMTNGALFEAINEMAKELRRYAGSDFNKCLNALETKAIRSIENAPIDGIPEDEQLRLVEQTRSLIAAAFADARDAG